MDHLANSPLTPELRRRQLWMLFFYAAAIALGTLNGLYGAGWMHDGAHFISTIFLKLFKFISIPIIAVSLISTLATLSQTSNSGKIFRRTVFYTILTTVIAASVAAGLYLLYAPENVSVGASAGDAVANITGKGYVDYIESVVPDNILQPFLSANVLSVLLIAAAFGVAIAKMPKGRSQEVLMSFFQGAQEVLFIIVGWIIKLLPIGIFGFITELFIEIAGGIAVGGLGTYFAAVLTANFSQMLIVIPLILLLKGINPVKLAREMSPALIVAFFSKSSAGTLPVTMSCAEHSARINPEVSRFVLPICTTVNMNACAAFILITVTYVMQNAGLEVTLGHLAVWVVIATIAAIGNAGVPMGCFFLSASLLVSMNVPIQLMGVILPVYAVIDMIETLLNVWSDSSVAKMVDKDMEDDLAQA